MARPEKILLEDLLVSQGLLTEVQLKIVLDEQRRSGHRLARVVAETGYSTEEAVGRMLAQQLHATFVDLRTFAPKPELVKLLPEAMARRYRVVVLDIKDGLLMVGFTDPTDLTAYDEISRIVQREISLAVVVESDLVPVLNRAYPRTEGDQGTDASAQSATVAEAEEDESDETFDIYVSLPTPVEKEILAQRLIDNIGIEADKLDDIVLRLTDRRMDRRTAKIRSEVSRKLVGKVADDCRRAGLEVEVRECLRLEVVKEKVVEEQTIQCPACGSVITAADKLKCPNCDLIVSKDFSETEYALKKKIEEEERARILQANEQRKKSNEELLKDEQEQKLREEVRAQLDLKKEQDLKLQREKERQQKLLKKRIIQLSSAFVVILVLAFVAIRWFAPKNAQPPAAGRDAKMAAAKPAAAPAENKPINLAGKIELAEGEVQVLDRDKKPRTVKTGDAINEGDSIVTGKNGELHIKMRDEGFIAVRPNTDMQVVTYRAQGDDQDGGVIALARGSFRSVTGWVGKFNSYAYQVKTPTATIGIRGTDHEPLVIPPGSTEGDPGTYDKVNIGSSYIETPQGRVDIPAGKAAFSPNVPQAEKMVPRLLSKVPDFFRPTQNEKTIEPRHAEIQKIVEQHREEQHKNAEQFCRK